MDHYLENSQSIVLGPPSSSSPGTLIERRFPSLTLDLLNQNMHFRKTSE